MCLSSRTTIRRVPMSGNKRGRAMTDAYSALDTPSH